MVTVSSNKGGVGKTTLAANLAVYLRALREDLPVLLFGLDDQHTLDRMFSLRPPQPGDGNLKHGWAERSFDRVIQLGEYGVHFVPSPVNIALLKARAENPRTLRSILARTDWPGIVIIDTKGDLEALTVNAFHAADRILIPVSDWASLEEAAKSLHLLEKSGLGTDQTRIVFTLVDRRTKLRGAESHMLGRLMHEVRSRGWHYYKTYISRSPRVEMLNSGTGRPLAILQHAKGTVVYAQMRDLTEEFLQDVAPGAALQPAEPAIQWGEPALAPPSAESLGDWAVSLLRSRLRR